MLQIGVSLTAFLLSFFAQLWLLNYFLGDMAISVMSEYAEKNPGANTDDIALIGDELLTDLSVIESAYSKVDYLAVIPFIVAALILSRWRLAWLFVLLSLSILASYPRVLGMVIYTVGVIIGWLVGVLLRKHGK